MISSWKWEFWNVTKIHIGMLIMIVMNQHVSFSRKTSRHCQWQREIYLSTRILRDQMGESDQDGGFICFMHYLVDFKTNRCWPTTIADFHAENDPAGRHRMMPVMPVRILWPHLPTCSNLNSMETRLRIFMCLHIRAIKPIKPYFGYLVIREMPFKIPATTQGQAPLELLSTGCSGMPYCDELRDSWESTLRFEPRAGERTWCNPLVNIFLHFFANQILVSTIPS